MIEIDGSLGEGGGQVLRSSLALSILTRQELRVYQIRAGRQEPGLQAQHLKALDAAAAISQAEVRGAVLRSREIYFRPQEPHSGRYHFEINTAGSAPLVLQTIFLPLARAGAASSLRISGGTHVSWSPCFHYLELNWLPVLEQMGFEGKLSLEAAGFYPQGGGRIDATIRPSAGIRPVQFTQRGALLRLSGLSAVANLDVEIAERQKRQALLRLSNQGLAPRIRTISLPSPVKGTLLLLLAEFEGGRACYFGLGEKGKPAERVADEAVNALLAFLDSPATVDEHLADQLLLPASLAKGPSEYWTPQISGHLRTNAAIIQRFLPVQIEFEGQFGGPGRVRVIP